MAIQNRVYVARKACGCIVAAFPVVMDKAVKGELLKQLAKAGYDIEQASDIDVRMDFSLTCDHNRPPLLAYMDGRTKEGAVSTEIVKEEGVEVADVDAAGNDLTPEAEEAEAAIEAEEAAAAESPAGIDHQAEADSLLNNFLEQKDEEADDDESDETEEDHE